MVCFTFYSCLFFVVFFFKQKTAYEMRISDWSSDVCSSDLPPLPRSPSSSIALAASSARILAACALLSSGSAKRRSAATGGSVTRGSSGLGASPNIRRNAIAASAPKRAARRSEEHTSELQSLMRISYAVFCLKKKTQIKQHTRSKET